MGSVLPVSNIINVTLSQTPSGLAERNVNTIGVFTNETPSNVDPFREYITATQVAEDYGTSSVTTAMANNVFAQTPNLRTGNGSLIIAPMLSSVSATQEKFLTIDISGNIVNLQAVTDGDLRITINGAITDIVNIDLSNATDLADIAQILQVKFTNLIITATATQILFESKKVGTSSEVLLASIPGGLGTDLTAVALLNTGAGTTTAGVNSSGETLLDAIARISPSVDFTGVITNLDLEDSAITAVAVGVQATDRIFVHHLASAEDIAGIATTVKTAGQTKTRLITYTGTMAKANLAKSAYVGRAFSVNFNGTATAQTMNLKELANVTPDTGINQTLYDQVKTAGTDLYVSYAGVPSVLSTGGNDFFDNVYNDLALKFALETAGFNHLRQTNTKVPQTEVGMNGLKDSYRRICNRFVNVGAVAPGSWTASETFGDPEIFKQNILTTGFYIFSLAITLQDPAERALRKAPLVQIAIKRAGAIHSSDVIVVVND